MYLCDLYSKVNYCGGFYGQTADGTPLLENISIRALKDLLVDLAPGASELVCHPAKSVDFDAMYTAERLRELAILCDDGVRRALETTELSFPHLVPFREQLQQQNSDHLQFEYEELQLGNQRVFRSY